MSKPDSKDQMLKAAQEERDALEALLNTLTTEQMTQPNIVGEWAIKDVLSHLMEWEKMVMSWYVNGLKGKPTFVPSREFNWGQLPQLNHAIYLKHRDKNLADVQKEFKASYKKIIKTIEGIPEKELFTRKIYAWTKNNLLAAYFISCTSSHYRWARTVIRKATKSK